MKINQLIVAILILLVASSESYGRVPVMKRHTGGGGGFQIGWGDVDWEIQTYRVGGMNIQGAEVKCMNKGVWHCPHRYVGSAAPASFDIDPVDRVTSDELIEYADTKISEGDLTGTYHLTVYVTDTQSYRYYSVTWTSTDTTSENAEVTVYREDF